MHKSIREGWPQPLGAQERDGGVNFAIFSRDANRVRLEFFDHPADSVAARVIDLDPAFNRTGDIWHVWLEGISSGQLYAYRVDGPYEPGQGQRFNFNRLLLDPFAGAVSQLPPWDFASARGYDPSAPEPDLVLSKLDNAGSMPKCIFVNEPFEWNGDQPPRHPASKTVIYETHVRGFTKLHPAVPMKQRGTFAGLGTREVVDYVKSLGVTSVELLPIHTFINDSHLLEHGLTNYWGYNSIGFFAPDPRYASEPEQCLREFKEMVARFHEAGLEIILDVVYNHTAEGNERGPTLSFKGIDNASYYRLLPDDKRYYINDTGTGNTLNVSHPAVIQMVTDSLRYWVNELHVDGFRFDLGTILAREPAGFDNQSGFLKVCHQDPVLRSVKLIAEPWDCGPGGYQVGGFPPGWAEWNDRYRDVVRDFWKGSAAASEVAQRLCASADVFNKLGRRPSSCVNFVTAHDGFTLNDLVTFNDKHNEANGEDNNDGSSDNRSWNCGVEGPTDDAAINALRERQVRNLLSMLLLSQGTPMMLAGDEFGRTQQGNNNAYCQDNEISWLNWDLTEKGKNLIALVQKLTELRHKYPILRRNRFLTGAYDEELDVKDLAWINASGAEMRDEDWTDERMRCFGMLMDGRARPTGLRQRGTEATMLMVLNAHHDLVEFELPVCQGGDTWTLVLDTNVSSNVSSNVAAQKFYNGDKYGVTARSLLLFALSEGQP